MKSLIKTQLVLLFAAALSLTACNSESNTSSSTTRATDSSGSGTGNSTAMNNTNMPADSGKSMSSPDQDAINYAVTKNTKELAWLQAGMDKGTNKELKAHAKMMMADHKKLDGEVSALVGKKGWKAPSVDTTGEVNINNKTGKDWDMAWTDKLIADHKEILDMFGKAKLNVKDEDLRALITKTVPVVQSHLDMANAMKGKMK